MKNKNNLNKPQATQQRNTVQQTTKRPTAQEKKQNTAPQQAVQDLRNNHKQHSVKHESSRYPSQQEPKGDTYPPAYIPEEYLKYFDQQDQYAHALSSIKLDPKYVYMLPLGGVGEIGMNCMMYQYKGRWLMIDCGNTFDRLYSHMSHIVMPNIEFAQQRVKELDGILITHGHEDHIGALPYLWPSLRVPIYSTKFTNILIRRKFEEHGLPTDHIIDIEPGHWYDIGVFKARWIYVSHSIPASCMIALRTEYGSILHTGDWKLDDSPLLNEHTDYESLKQLASEDLTTIVSDSTNITVDGYSPTEDEVGKSLSNLIKSIRKGKIFVTFFSTNISRLHSCIEAAKYSGRKVAIMGRALQRSYESAIEAGYIEKQAHVLLEDFDAIPSEKLLIACSGSQGEDRSALTRIARDTHRQIKIHAGDTVLFSCRLIPTNAKEVVNLENALVRKGVNVITNDDHLIHSSGHARKPEFERFYQLISDHAVRNIFSIPVHGTSMFLRRHAEFAKKYGFKSFSEEEIFGDGKIYKIAPKVEFVDYIEHTAQFIDGKKLVSVKSPLLQERRALQEGVISVSVVVAHGKHLLHTHVCSYGVDEDRNWVENQVRRQVQAVFATPITTSLNKAIRNKIVSFTKYNLDKQVCIQLHVLNSNQFKRGK